MFTSKNIHISKLDAAKRQIDSAIVLFLNNGDPVSIHTLTAASHQLLIDLGKKQRISSFVKEEVCKSIRPEKVKEYEKMVSEAENFFKHADRDPDELLKFPIGQTSFLLWDACQMYPKLTDETTPLITVYNMWFFVRNSDILDSSVVQYAKSMISKLGLDSNNRKQFLNLLPEIISGLKK